MKSDDFKDQVIPYSPRLFVMAARLLGDDEEARDAVQEIMIKLWNSRKDLERHPNIAGFVFLTGRNYCLDRLKARKSMHPSNINQELIPDIHAEQGQYEMKEVFAFIQKIIGRLPENQKEVIIMRDLDGLEFEEISAIINLKVEHTRVLLSRARKFVATELEKIYNYEQGR